MHTVLRSNATESTHRASPAPIVTALVLAVPVKARG
jgi:hypothetical protein